MNFLIETILLYQSLQKIISIISGRPRLLILNHILLVMNKNYLFVTATDLEIEITVEICLHKTCVNSFSFTVSGRKFFDICRSVIEYSKISVELIDKKLVISAGSSCFSLSTLPAFDFPKLESQINIVVELEISQIVLKKMIELTQFSMGHQDARYYLNGMCFEIKDNIIRFVTTDGHRLAVCSVSIHTSVRYHIMIIPRKSIYEILRLLSIEKKGSLVNIQIGNNNICLKINNYKITSKLIDAVFPRYQNIFVKQPKNILEVLRNNLKQALKRAAIISNEKFRTVQFILMDNILTIVAKNFENEMLEERLDVVYTGESMEISFNINYLLDILNAMDAEIVKFLFIDAVSSVQIEGSTKHYDEQYIVMPIRM